MQNPKFFGQKYVPEYARDYHSLPWYERDLMSYLDYLKYKDMSDNPDFYFENKKVKNFEIIHHQCKGDPLTKTEKEHKTVFDFKNYPKDEKNKVLFPIFRNKQDDLWVKRDLMIEYLKKKFSIFNLL